MAALALLAFACDGGDLSVETASGSSVGDAAFGGPDLVGSGLDGGQDASADDVAAQDAPDQGAAAPETAGGGPVQGAVLIFELDTGTASYDRGNAAASFGPLPEDSPPSYTAAPCEVRWHGTEAPPGPSADAGVIQITGTAIPVDLQRAPESGVYRSSLPDTNADIFAKGGGPIHVASTGGAEVPPFSGDLPAPAPVQITAPALGLTSFVSTSEPMTVTWTADAPGKVARTLVGVSAVGLDFKPISGDAVVCTVPGDATTVTVPKEAMAALPGSFGTRLVVSVTRVVEAHVSAGGVPVTLAATASFGGVASAK